jgi:hypothetical protein
LAGGLGAITGRLTTFIHEQRTTQILGEALLDFGTAPSANYAKQGGQGTERNQSKQNVLGKKRKCAENSDAQKVAAGTRFGISHCRVKAISDSTDGKPAFPKSFEKQFDAIQKHQDNRDQSARRGEDHYASSDDYDRRQHLPGSIQSF